MHSLLALVLSLVAVNAYKPVGPPVAGSGERIIGGTNAAASDAPYQISLVKNSDLGPGHICGGSLLDKRTVLTAAHCCEGATADSLTVKYGGTDRLNLANSRQVKEVIPHPAYSSRTINNDYCVIKLSSDVVTGADVAFITIASSSATVGTVAQLTGWGRTNSLSPNIPTKLQKVNFKIASAVECSRKWSGLNPVTKNMICASNKTASGCNGDSGGPLTANGQLVGISSWGSNGCPSDTTIRPVVFSDPAESSARAWIMSKASLEL